MQKNIVPALSLTLLVAIAPFLATAQDLRTKGRSVIELNIGFWTGPQASTTAGGTGFTSEAKLSGFAGGVTYAYGLEESWALTLSAGVLAAQASASAGILGTQQQASTVVPFLIGVRYYAIEPTPESQVRPFLSGGIGPFLGAEAKNTVLSQQAHTETAFGGRLGLGIDFLLGLHVKLGVDVGYNLMSDFSAPVGARRNYNGLDGGLRIGYIF